VRSMLSGRSSFLLIMLVAPSRSHVSIDPKYPPGPMQNHVGCATARTSEPPAYGASEYWCSSHLYRLT